MSFFILSSLIFFSLFLNAEIRDFLVPKTKAELEKMVLEKINSIKGRSGVYIKHFESGEEIGVNAHERFQLASVFKIPLLFALFKQISLGRISLDDRIILSSRMKTYGSGLLTSMKPGLNLSIEDLQLLMMAESDNTATDILFDLVSKEAVAEYMKELGLKKTTIDYNTRELILAYLGLDPLQPLTIEELRLVPDSFWESDECRKNQTAFDHSEHDTSTPFEIGLLLEKCLRGEIVNKEMSDKILETMKHHTGAELILRFLPFGTIIARKGGSLARYGNYTVLNDAGIIWLPSDAGRLIICIFTNNLNELHYELKDKIGLVSRAAYDYFLEKYKK